MDLPTYTNIWRIEKRLYKLYDLRLPMPLPIVWIGVFVGVLVPWWLFLLLVGVPFAAPWHVVYLVPPGVVTWLSTRPVIEGKRLTEVLQSQLRYLAEPRTWCRMAPAAEPETVTLTARVWRIAPSSAPVRVKAARKAVATETAGQGETTEALGAAVKSRGADTKSRGTDKGRGTDKTRGTDKGRGAGPRTRTPETAARARAGGNRGRGKAVEPWTPDRVIPARALPPAPGGQSASPGRPATVHPAVAAAAAAASPVTDSPSDAWTRPAAKPATTGEPVKAVAADEPVFYMPKPPASTGGKQPPPIRVALPERATPPALPPASPATPPALPPASSAASSAPAMSPATSPDPGAEEPAAPVPPIGTEALRRLRRLAASAESAPESVREPASRQTRHASSEPARELGPDEVAGPPRHAAPRPDSVLDASPEVTREPVIPEPAAESAQEPQAQTPAQTPAQGGVQGTAETSPAREPVSDVSGNVAEEPVPEDEHTGHAVKPEQDKADEPREDTASRPQPSASDRQREAWEQHRKGQPPRPARPGPPPAAPAPAASPAAPVVPLAGRTPAAEASPAQPPAEAPAARPPAAEAAAARPAPQPVAETPADRPAAERPAESPQAPAAGPSQGVGRGVSIRRVPTLPQASGPATPVLPPAALPSSPVNEPRVRRVESVVGRGSSGGWRRIAQVVVGGSRTDGMEVDEARTRTPLTTSRRIMVLGCTGGAGQTTTALMLGHTLARYREDRVLALDANSGDNTLTTRIQAESPETLSSLLEGSHSLSGYLGMRAYTTRCESGLEVVGADTDAGAEQRLADRTLLNDWRRTLSALDQHYRLVVVDPAAALAARLLPYTDQLVLVAPASADASDAIAMTYEWLDGHGVADLRRRAVMVINGVSRRSMPDVEQAEAVASGRCRAIVRVPWEDELAPGRPGPVDVNHLRTGGRRAYVALAGVIVSGLATIQAKQEVAR
ncbi:TcpE family conjugal transfer membrane protein [Planotetraspora kaengkrachanensis]|uniref:MinD-like ATPase involved in chromosome partitioning or flagellar assembly n=1 Tax=Planotetraspora kaengkrachanensis TaxID=575193 RepID=A0A8J3LYI3_9ACTN|nr:TcpE family conjugal transfer membrane protein [Planotetraspora kaengkrachanensis]GIG80234.1 hypothetical protein Pka01_33610 [Planotetraspora kaengkrachanensis]